MDNLLSKLRDYSQSKAYPFHMPGHKRNMSGYPMEPFYNIDITEIPGFDDLHHPQGILQELTLGYEALYKAKTFLLVNGSTCGILAAISALCGHGDEILMGRNCHQSVYNAVALRGAKALYLMDDKGCIHPGEVKALLEYNNKIKGVIITSPTYEGLVSDVRSIGEICHSHGVPLIVDGAHGAHFVLDERFPEDAVSCGGDVVIHSLHKTLPALTQTALLHVQGSLVDRDKLAYYLRVYQTSSPSYILMASMGECLDILNKQGRDLCDDFFERLAPVKEILGNAPGISREINAFDRDPCKVNIPAPMGGAALFDILVDKYGLVPEMAGPGYVTLILSIMDSMEGFSRLNAALRDLMEADDKFNSPNNSPYKTLYKTPYNAPNTFFVENPPEIVYTIGYALGRDRERVAVKRAAGRISAGFVRVYPPGIPLLVPGERIGAAHIALIDSCKKQDLNVQGALDDEIFCISAENTTGNGI